MEFVAQADPAVGRPPRRGALALALAGALALLAGAGLAAESAFSTDQARRLFVTGYDNLNNVYIRKINVGQVALDGLKGLAQIDAAVAVERRGKRVYATVGGVGVADYGAPSDDDVGGWAEITAKAMAALRMNSVALGGAAPEKLYQAVFDAGLAPLDKYSRYASAETARENRAAREGFGGIGIRLETVNERITVQSVLANTPADKVGLKANDKIMRVGGKPIAGMDLKDVVALMRGKVGSSLALEVEREGTTGALKFEMRRALIVPPTVAVTRDGDIAEIKLSGFNHDTGVSLANTLDGLRTGKQGKVRGIVLDMRNNPGGLLDQAVVVADLFLPGGQIVSTRGRHPDSTQLFNATGRDALKGIPVVVLINGTSASAAEIVAAALQDRGRAVLVGTATFGKGSVQTVIRLPNDGELTLTWAHFHAPSGYSINRLGVFPTICTSRTATPTPVVVESVLGGSLAGAMDLAIRRSADALAEGAQDELMKACPWQPGAEADVEAQVAKGLLRNPELYGRALQQSLSSIAAKP